MPLRDGLQRGFGAARVPPSPPAPVELHHVGGEVEVPGISESDAVGSTGHGAPRTLIFSASKRRRRRSSPAHGRPRRPSRPPGELRVTPRSSRRRPVASATSTSFSEVSRRTPRGPRRVRRPPSPPLPPSRCGSRPRQICWSGTQIWRHNRAPPPPFAAVDGIGRGSLPVPPPHQEALALDTPIAPARRRPTVAVLHQPVSGARGRRAPTFAVARDDAPRSQSPADACELPR